MPGKLQKRETTLKGITTRSNRFHPSCDIIKIIIIIIIKIIIVVVVAVVFV